MSEWYPSCNTAASFCNLSHSLFINHPSILSYLIQLTDTDLKDPQIRPNIQFRMWFSKNFLSRFSDYMQCLPFRVLSVPVSPYRSTGTPRSITNRHVPCYGLDLSPSPSHRPSFPLYISSLASSLPFSSFVLWCPHSTLKNPSSVYVYLKHKKHVCIPYLIS